MVKQPLPLPQGVSDYAVGNRYHAGKGICLASPPSGIFPLKTGTTQEELKCKKDDCLTEKPAGETSYLEKTHLQIKKITVTEGLSKISIRKLIEKNIHSIERCCREKFGRQTLKGELVFSLVIDNTGRVIKATSDRKNKEIKGIRRCIIQELKRLHFQTPEAGKKVVVTITFVLK